MIRYLVLDIDGTLTDGKLYIGPEGEAMKAFCVKDGAGIKLGLPPLGIIPIVITARRSDIVRLRCAELGIDKLHQGVADKLACLASLLEARGGDLSEVAYVGDDLPDLPALEAVARAGGLAACPADAVSEVASACTYVSPLRAGDGAVRDIIGHIAARRQQPAPALADRLREAVSFIDSLDPSGLNPGRHDVRPDFHFNLMDYSPAREEDTPFEAHRRHIDIQRLIAGEELMQVADARRLLPLGPYDGGRDCTLFAAPADGTATLLLRPGSVLVLHPRDAHRAVRHTAADTPVRKVVGKLMVDYEG